MKNLKTLSLTVLATVCLIFSACEKEPVDPPVEKPDPAAFKVKVEFSEIANFNFNVTFAKGDSVATYNFIALKSGTMADQLEFFGPMFGVDTEEKYVLGFGVPCTADTIFEYKSMDPGTEYEVYVLPTLKSGELGDMQIHKVSTISLGGSGEAKIEVEMGMFFADTIYTKVPDTDRDTSYCEYVQYLTVKPNEECALFRYTLSNKDTFDIKSNDQEYIDYLSLENNPGYPEGMEDPYWNQYKEKTEGWYVDPASSFYVISIAKNADGKYGPLQKYEFTTPEAEPYDRENDPNVVDGKNPENTAQPQTAPRSAIGNR